MKRLAPMPRRGQLKGPPSPTLHDQLKMGLRGAFGHAVSRRDMSADHQRDLVELYPTLYRWANEQPAFPSPAFARDGFAVGDGWYSIIKRLSAKLATNRKIAIVQVKEKDAFLRVYLNRKRLRAEFLEAVLKAKSATTHTCELCGMGGRLVEQSPNWFAVRCQPCDGLDHIASSCHKLGELARSRTLVGFSNDEIVVNAAKLEITQIGRSTACQPARHRARLPCIPWKRLDGLNSAIAVKRWSPSRVWRFIKHEAPNIEEALR